MCITISSQSSEGCGVVAKCLIFMSIGCVNLKGKRTRCLSKGIHVNSLVTENVRRAGGGHGTKLKGICDHVVESLLGDDVL